jgi:PKD repeat protein
VKFTDVSWNAPYSDRLWTFPADADLGNYSNTDKAPVVTFNSPGWKEVTLVVSNANRFISEGKIYGIRV